MATMKNAFIFDFDGTLGETEELVIAAICAAYRDFGLSAPSRDEIVSHFGPNELGLFKVLRPADGEKFFERYLAHYAELAKHYSPAPFDGIKDVLETLYKNSVPMAIVTGKCRKSLLISLAVYGISDYFSVLECGSESGVVKPEKIRNVLERWSAAETLGKVYYVGDIVSDVLNSLKAGVIPLSAAWSKHADVNALRKSPTSKVFESVADFAQWVRENAL